MLTEKKRFPSKVGTVLIITQLVEEDQTYCSPHDLYTWWYMSNQPDPCDVGSLNRFLLAAIYNEQPLFSFCSYISSIGGILY